MTSSPPDGGNPTSGYSVPAAETSIEIRVRNSRFLGICAAVDTVESAREFLNEVRRRHADASHHVYAFAVGHGATVTHGMSDDGEPSGTAGRPLLAVVQGSGLGDVIVVVVRWFGGTKLGTGGLVRAYTAAAQQALAATLTRRKVDAHQVVVRLPYDRFDACREAIRRTCEEVEIAAETFGEDALLTLRGPSEALDALLPRLRDLTSGRAAIVPGDEPG